MPTAHWHRALSGLLLLGVLLTLALPWPSGAQTPSPQPEQTVLGLQPDEAARVDEILAGMTTADKVGQLFLVTFEGADASLTSEIARLVQVYRIGGVILAPENGNLVNDATAPQQVWSLTTALQTLAFTDSLPVEVVTTIPLTRTMPLTPTAPLTPTTPLTLTVPVTGTPSVAAPATATATQLITLPAQGIPLFIAVSQEGDGYPHTALRGGFTELPSNMALGATWNDINAEAVGWIVGHELSAVGVNLLLGPSLDVLSTPRPAVSGDLGLRVFGGDPYWVGRMGQAYIRGVRRGSAGTVATVGKHLPGLGASERSLEEEVSTVDRSLDALRLIELQPFFAVTRGTPITDTIDALMTAHIRYRGFQGNIRYVTRPLSLDAQGMQQIMAQPELVPWREAGGLLVSDSLGVPAIRRYYSPKLDAFPSRQIAMEAFQAGNDMLTLSRFSLTDSWTDQLRNIEDTVLFFRERYEADESFRTRVDQSVRRILRLKLRLCPDWSLEGCRPAEENLSSVGRSRTTVNQIAQSSVTLLYPPVQELALRLARPPRFDEDVLIFADARQIQECPSCPASYLLDPNNLRDTILRMYGPGATGQIDSKRVSTFTFAQLGDFLSGTQGSPNLAPLIDNADWIVFAVLDYNGSEYGSAMALKDFLREQTAGLETKNVIVIAYGAPYYLDTTEVSKLTAYYGVYGRTTPFVEASVQALFQEFVPTGRPPVTVDGVGYNLSEQLRPDPAQVIEVVQADQPPSLNGTPEPVKLKVGDPLRVRTGVIVDRNGNAVPDDTPVLFRAIYVEEEGLGRTFQVMTKNGVAEAVITLERPGVLQITASSEPAFNSRPLEARSEGEIIVIATATPPPTATPTPTPEPSPTPTPTPSLTPEPTETPVVTILNPPLPKARVEWADLVLALVGMGAAGGLLLVAVREWGSSIWAWNPPVRAVLWSMVCGLAGYLFYGLGLPGSSFMEGVSAGWRGLIIGFGCGLLPLASVVWRWARHRYDWEARALSRR